MHRFLCLLSGLTALALAAPQAIDYGPCDYNGNDNCKEIMDNTACFLNPVGADEIFKCISGGREGVGCIRHAAPGFTEADSLIGLRMLRVPRLQARWRCYCVFQRLRVSLCDEGPALGAPANF